VLIPHLYYTVNYNGESSTSYDEGYLADMYSWRLGPPKLRQLRVKKGDFMAVWVMTLEAEKCLEVSQAQIALEKLTVVQFLSL